MSTLKAEDKKYLLSLKPEDINFELLVDLFADRVNSVNGKPKIIQSRIKPTDEFTLEANEYFNTKKVKTTAGQFIYNKFIVEEKLQNVLGYVNEPIDKSGLKKIENKLAKALLNDEITGRDFVSYLDKTQWLSLKFHVVITNSFTPNTLKPNMDIMRKKNKLFKDNKDKLDAGDINTAVRIEKELVEYAGEILKDDPGLNLYTSGARGSMKNNYKNIAIMRGPVYDPVSNKYDIVESSFMEGIKKEEIPVYGNLIITGAYPN